MRAIITLFLALCNSMLNALVLWKLWEWFVTPLGVMHIGYWHAYALGLFASWHIVLGTKIKDLEPKVDNEKYVVLLISVSIAMMAMLGIAYLIHLYGMG